jgi:hypothetical protein
VLRSLLSLTCPVAWIAAVIFAATGIALAQAGPSWEVPPGAMRLLASATTTIASFLEPEQWPARAPSLSQVVGPVAGIVCLVAAVAGASACVALARARTDKHEQP